jgi:hypothetical protein
MIDSTCIPALSGEDAQRPSGWTLSMTKGDSGCLRENEMPKLHSAVGFLATAVTILLMDGGETCLLVWLMV